jgi:2-polyprenyl-3-methyl-5-hydroxy-6-metoxy-1,4-benzoquinol methylase
LPSQQQLNELYNSFAEGMDVFIHNNRKKNPLTKWYNQCIAHAIAYFGNGQGLQRNFTWIDIGAGAGELCKLMSERFPGSTGYGIDFHPKPDLLKQLSNVHWHQCNLNDENEIQKLPLKNIDVAFSITVLEHVQHPDVFIKNIIPVINENGVFYLTTPDFSSALARLSGRYWSYIQPGEHLNIPSKKGISILLNRLVSELQLNSSSLVYVKPTVLPYPVSYYLQHFKLSFLSKLFSPTLTSNFPTGILEAGIVFRKENK